MMGISMQALECAYRATGHILLKSDWRVCRWKVQKASGYRRRLTVTLVSYVLGM